MSPPTCSAQCWPMVDTHCTATVGLGHLPILQWNTASTVNTQRRWKLPDSSGIFILSPEVTILKGKYQKDSTRRKKTLVQKTLCGMVILKGRREAVLGTNSDLGPRRTNLICLWLGNLYTVPVKYTSVSSPLGLIPAFTRLGQVRTVPLTCYVDGDHLQGLGHCEVLITFHLIHSFISHI